MIVFLVQQSSEDSSNQQAQPVSSLVATSTQPTASVIQQLPSDRRAQMRHKQQQTQSMITQQQLSPPLPPGPTAESASGVSLESVSFPPPSLSSSIFHLSNGQPEEQHGM